MASHQFYDPALDGPRQKPKKRTPADLERQQRLKEYRVALRREKRARKGDEKRQRKLNATILRRMTKNPDKYNKNADRNRTRDIEAERRRIQNSAIRQAEDLAAIHDPSGATFNVGPVTTQEDGTVVALEVLERRKQREAAKLAAEGNQARGELAGKGTQGGSEDKGLENGQFGEQPPSNSVNVDRLKMIESHQRPNGVLAQSQYRSKTQQKKLDAMKPKPPPRRPIIPEGISVPKGEQNWLALWDLNDDELVRRVAREKKRKAAERKDLRNRQKAGKDERRAARDLKRFTYRELKQEWKEFSEIEKHYKRRLQAVEDEEYKKLADKVNAFERRIAMAFCAALGFTLENTDGVDDIKPVARGMKGQQVNFEDLEAGKKLSQVSVKTKPPEHTNPRRVNLGAIGTEEGAAFVHPSRRQRDEDSQAGDFISLEFGAATDKGQDYEEINYNNRMRRKLHRAMDTAQVRKEMVVRQRAIDYCEANGIETPPELLTPAKPARVKPRRTRDDGTLETDKQERVRKRLELAEYNKVMKVLRKQAKDVAEEAGLRKHAELTGKIPVSTAVNGSGTKQYPTMTNGDGDVEMRDDSSGSDSDEDDDDHSDSSEDSDSSS